MRDWQTLAERIRREPGVVGVAPYLDLQGMIGRGEDLRAALIRGIEPQLEPQVSEIGAHMTVGPARRSAAGRAAHRARRGSRVCARCAHRRRDHRARAGRRRRRARARSPASICSRASRPSPSAASSKSARRSTTTCWRSCTCRTRRRSPARGGAPGGLRLKFADIFAAPTRVQGDCGVAGQRPADQRLVDRERQLLPRRRASRRP